MLCPCVNDVEQFYHCSPRLSTACAGRPWAQRSVKVGQQKDGSPARHLANFPCTAYTIGMGGKDIAEKALEEYDDVFSDIVNVLLFGGEQLVKEDELTEAAPLSVYKDDGGKLREQERDISKFWKDGRIRICLYGLENVAA